MDIFSFFFFSFPLQMIFILVEYCLAFVLALDLDFFAFKIHLYHRQHIFQFIKSCDSCVTNPNANQIQVSHKIEAALHIHKKRPLKLPMKLRSFYFFFFLRSSKENLRFYEQSETKNVTNLIHLETIYKYIFSILLAIIKISDTFPLGQMEIKRKRPKSSTIPQSGWI